MRRLVVFLPALMLLPAQGQAPDMVIRIKVNLVQVDAVVTDAKGRPDHLSGDRQEVPRDRSGEDPLGFG